MADVVTGKFRNTNTWLWVAAVIAVVLVGGGAGVGVRLYQSRHSTRQLTPTVKKTAGDTAQDLSLYGDYAGAQDQLQKALAKPGLSANDKYELYYQQGATYQNQGNNQAALDSFKQAETFQKTQNLYESMGAVAHLLGDDTTAINYYKLAIQNIPTDNPLRATYKANYEQVIQQLGGTP